MIKLDWKEFLSKPALMVMWGTKEEIESFKKNKEFLKLKQNGLSIEK